MSNTELLDFVSKSDAPAAEMMINERRNAFWNEYRSALLKMQHLVLEGHNEEMRDLIGRLLDRSRWVVNPQGGFGEDPLGGLMIERLRVAMRLERALKSRITKLKNMLSEDDKIFREMEKII